MERRLILSRGVVHPWHLDHFGHMNVRNYAPFFDDAGYHLWSLMGMPFERMIEDHGVHTVTGQATTRFLRELKAGDLVEIDGAVARIGNRSVTFSLRMLHLDSRVLHATYETTEVLFDPATRQSAAMPAGVRDRLLPHLLPPAAA
jgi:acyl-CoA thioester hydrolase